ncbi:uncharacterized protein PFL1_05073 [Pseudozyma flocculosa PF-1]|uniref:mRNA m(6)A methyltransferase n=1 Tax=Pseudozyma flocculosa PF-1 TaxID=1277687 RepID=A0A061H6C4_9BASI|nr:uncharacterized protein PFL1_05073 [Pseudozyma flocculosa PF-1]EPQ27535.1 hypothetical protein PFL1_05073 [Pseudozyma flocculosa PF-1]
MDQLTSIGSRQALGRITESFLARPTAKQRIYTKLMKSTDNRFQQYCDHLTRQECHQAKLSTASTSTSAPPPCQKLHFRPVFYPQTDPSYGHCSYLNTCHRTSTCKYLHFELDASPPHEAFAWQTSPEHPYEPDSAEARDASLIHPSRMLAEKGLQCWIRNHDPQDGDFRDDGRIRPPSEQQQQQLPAQWIDCDLKNFDYSILGKFDIIVADPPWDIHMSLPYGTMSDDDLRAMPVPELQDEGLLFLWTTGRAMELGRELLGHWGYTRIDELIWIKVGQTQRLIRTGRTGHHLNHTKEHCLVGAKVSTGRAGRYQGAAPLAGASQPYFASHAAGIPPPLPPATAW